MQKALLTTKVVEKNGKKYRNFCAVISLDNGEEVDFQFKLAFYNKKFAYKLAKLIEEGSDEDGE